MTEIDDNLLKQFFGEHKQEVPDRGFSARVMHRLPHRAGKLSGILITCCTILSTILFFALDGFQATIRILREVFVSMVQQSALSLDLRTLLFAGAVLLIFGIRRIYTTE